MSFKRHVIGSDEYLDFALCTQCISTVDCNIGEINPHFAKEALAALS